MTIIVGMISLGKIQTIKDLDDYEEVTFNYDNSIVPLYRS